MGNPEPGVKMEANALGGGQDISQRPRVHVGIHMSTPFPQKALQRPGPAQGHWGANLGTCPQRVQFLPEVGGWRLPILDAQSLHSVFCSLGLRGVGQAGRALGGHGKAFTGRPVTWGSPICFPGWMEACCSRGCWRPGRGSC